jgi:hypothetical protein
MSKGPLRSTTWALSKPKLGTTPHFKSPNVNPKNTHISPRHDLKLFPARRTISHDVSCESERTKRKLHILLVHERRSKKKISRAFREPGGLLAVSKGIESLEGIESIPPLPPSTTASRETHKCPLCPSTSGYKFGSFKRHLDKHGIRECEYRCPHAGCDKKSHRRDRAQSHYQSHGHYMSLAEVPLTRVHLPFPSHCPVCLDKMSSWGAFWKHIKGHSIIRRGSGNLSISADSNLQDSDISGKGGSANGPSSLSGQHHSSVIVHQKDLSRAELNHLPMTHRSEP